MNRLLEWIVGNRQKRQGQRVGATNQLAPKTGELLVMFLAGQIRREQMTWEQSVRLDREIVALRKLLKEEGLHSQILELFLSGKQQGEIREITGYGPVVVKGAFSTLRGYARSLDSST